METSMRSYRKELVRNFFVFQFKLLLDGIKDVLLFNFTIIIVLIDLVSGDPGHCRFKSILQKGRRFDVWLKLYEYNPPGHDESGEEE